MTQPRFEWDERKNDANERKHGISFEEAETVFSDERAQLIHDPDHSEEEDRFVLLGLSAAMRTLVVCHCYRESDDRIRIISVRKANRLERESYMNGWHP
ncbi:MAG TPA: BrnT family toxin [Myxococcales bacterium]|nr:BrnT family toxin [Myxococcales bacterium]